MTIWDNIFKEKKKTADDWVTPSEQMFPLFNQFLDKNDWKTKYAFDIGCGTGKFLKLLQDRGFGTDGLDSSETAVEMTLKRLGDNSTITCAEMFDFPIPKNKYDLIISILTIHHGTKKQVQKIINDIHDALVENGRTFITVPDFESSKKWNSFKDHDEIEPGTFIPLGGAEKGLPHSFYTKDEAKQLFSRFKEIELILDEYGNWIVEATK